MITNRHRTVLRIDEAELCGVDPGATWAEVGTRDDWIPAAVPGDVRTALRAASRIDDPDRDPHDQATRWVDDLEWWYRFPLPSVTGLGPDERLVLRFAGIDTFANVYVDGERRHEHGNMFRAAELDVTQDLVGAGAHEVIVQILRPMSIVAGGAGPDDSEARRALRTRVRKAQYGFGGWDFGPDRPSLGLWRPVVLERRDRRWIDTVRFQTLRIGARHAVVEVEVAVGSVTERSTAVTVAIELTAPSGRRVLASTADVVDGVARAVATVDDPELWWPHDHGRPNLHDLHLELRVGDDVVDRHDTRVGIRTVELDESSDPHELGSRFFRFVVNGRAIFAKGANWVPAGMEVGSIPDATYRDRFDQAVAANMNMIRIWGGGVYETETFYELCDELGLLVWQDFMFAGPPHAGDEAWLEDVRQEAIEQVRRLRSHACLALWCGNNEIEAIAWINDPSLRHSVGAEIFYGVLGDVVAEEDGVLGYIASSPILGNGEEQGDRHVWDVWHGIHEMAKLREPGADVVALALAFGMGVELDPDSPEGQAKAESISAAHYLEDMTRFSSEFGMRSMPARATLAQVIDDEHLVLGDPQLTARNRDALGPTNKVELAISLVGGAVHDVDDLIDLSQLTQAEGLKLGIEHYRRRWPHCAGSLIWQLNDCWPGPTWSLIDHLGRPKAALAYARRFYAPVLASLVADADGGASLWVVNDTASAVTDELQVRLAPFDDADVWAQDVAVEVGPRTAQPVRSWTADELDPGPDRALRVRSTAGLAPDNRLFFTPIKDLALRPPELDVTCDLTADGHLHITVRTDAHALFVHALADDPAVRFDDGYVDLEAGQARTFTSTGPCEPGASGSVRGYRAAAVGWSA